MDGMGIWIVIGLLIPGLLYAGGRVTGRGVWGLVREGYKSRGVGAYRAAPEAVWKEGKAPLVVHAAAISSFLLGQMVIPGAIAALVGLLVSMEMLMKSGESIEWMVVILTLSAPTGLFVAGGLLAAGLALMRRSAGASKLARRIGWSAIGHNVALVAAIGVVAMFKPSDEAVLFPIGYAFISCMQALLLLSAARALDARDAAEARDREEGIAPPEPQIAR